MGPRGDDDRVVAEDLLLGSRGRLLGAAPGVRRREERGRNQLRVGADPPDAIDAVIRNTFIQGTLSIVFAVLVLIVVAAGVVVCIRAVRAGGLPTTETPPDVPSKIFAPAGFVPTPPRNGICRNSGTS